MSTHNIGNNMTDFLQYILYSYFNRTFPYLPNTISKESQELFRHSLSGGAYSLFRSVLRVVRAIRGNIPELSEMEWEQVVIAIGTACREHRRTFVGLLDYLMNTPLLESAPGENRKLDKKRCAVARELVRDALANHAESPLVCIYVCARFESLVQPMSEETAEHRDDGAFSPFVYAMQ